MKRRDDRLWHGAAVPAALTNVRNWGQNGLNADMSPRPSLTRSGHRATA